MTAPTRPHPAGPRLRRVLWRALAALALLAIVAYLGALGWIASRQNSLLFKPTLLAADHAFDFGADVHELWLDVPGARLNALQLRLPHPRGVAFYLHGNAGNLQSVFAGQVTFYRAAGYDLFMVDYRGFGKSTGQLTDGPSLSADVARAWQAMQAQYALPGAPAFGTLRKVIVGRSLGSALAAELAAQVQPDLTVLVSPYRSMLAMSAEKYPWVPGLLLRYPLRTDAFLPRIRGPVLMVHGTADTLIPIHHSDQLQALRPGTELLRVPGATHADIDSAPAWRTRLAAALAAL